jgi:bacteriorhodopsin
MNIFHTSAYGSLCIQLLTGLFEIRGLFLNVPSEDMIVKDILTMEIIVQGVEFLFYVYLVYKIVTKHVSNSITSHRYFDWAITTPVMLISFILFFKYLKDPERNIRWTESVREELSNIAKILPANALMLLFGYLGEQSIINKYLGVAIGFIPFAYAFKILYAEYAEYTTLAKYVFYPSFLVWSLYGVGAVLPFAAKNTMYNILDLFAKNAYGLFLTLFLMKKSIV